MCNGVCFTQGWGQEKTRRLVQLNTQRSTCQVDHFADIQKLRTPYVIDSFLADVGEALRSQTLIRIPR